MVIECGAHEENGMQDDAVFPCVAREAAVFSRRPGRREGRVADAGIDLLRSSLDLLILKALTWGPMHGYGIGEWIDDATQSLLLVEEGTLYPALHRLERRGWITAEWGVSGNNRRAKFYSTTPAGRARLRAETRRWHEYAGAIAAALRRTDPALA
jgi:transcriptional regulator